MLCPTCLGSNMTDMGDYYQCSRCNDVRPKCQHDRGVARFQEICLGKRQPTRLQRFYQGVRVFWLPITTATLTALLIIVLMLLQMGGR